MASARTVKPVYGSDDAFAVAIAQHHERLAGFAYLLCGNRHTAEDLVAEAYAKVWPKYRNRQIDDLEPYLRRAVVNLATGRLRRLRLERRETERAATQWRIAETGAAVNRIESDSAERDRLWRAIWALPPEQRVVIVMRIVEDRSEHDTASCVSVNLALVRWRGLP